MKMDLLMSLLSFQGLTVSSLLAQLWPGEAAKQRTSEQPIFTLSALRGPA